MNIDRTANDGLRLQDYEGGRLCDDEQRLNDVPRLFNVGMQGKHDPGIIPKIAQYGGENYRIKKLLFHTLLIR